MYNFKLFFQNFIQSFFRSKRTHGHLTRKRFIFLILFYLVWPLWGVILWISFIQDHIFFPGFHKKPLDKPLFVIGNFRSGSTYLQRLISLDPQFTSPTIWDIFISPSITLTKIFSVFRCIDRFFGSPVFRFLKNLDQRTLGKVDIHKISLFEPEEDENFLLHLWSTFYACTMFPFIDKFDDYIYFDHRIDEKRKSKIMHFYKSCVNRYMHARPQKKHYLSKNPSFSPKISSVYESFPDARIIYLVRNPLEMLPSTISWWAYTWHTFSDPKTKYPFVDEIKKFTKHWYQYPLEILDKSTPDSYLILQYDRLFKDTESVVKAIYDKFGYELTPAFQQMLKEKIEKSKGFRSKHTYALEEMGLTQEQILDEYKYVFDRFNFETDPAKICLKKQYNENFLD